MEDKQMKTTLGKNKEGYGYCYTDLAQINKYCDENDIRYFQEVETSEINGQDYIYTTILEKEKEPRKIKGCKVVDAVLSGIKNPVQEYGSSLTYCRRYSLLMALGLAPEDNDAQDLTMPAIQNKEEAKAYKLTFGKYAGKTLGEVPESYLQWLFENSKEETIKTACDFLMQHPTDESIRLLQKVEELLVHTETDREKFYDYFKVKNTNEMNEEQLQEAIKLLDKKEK